MGSVPSCRHRRVGLPRVEGAREYLPAPGMGLQGWPTDPMPRRPRFSFSDFSFANIVAATATLLPAVGTSWPFVMQTGALQTFLFSQQTPFQVSMLVFSPQIFPHLL